VFVTVPVKATMIVTISERPSAPPLASIAYVETIYAGTIAAGGRAYKVLGEYSGTNLATMVDSLASP
jgi:hypothetical protein